MPTLIYLLKAHLLFVILGAVYHFVLRNEKSFTFNRFYLLAIYGASTLAPLLEFKIFKNTTFLDLTFLTSGESANPVNKASQFISNDFFTLDTLLPKIYMILVAISIVIFVIKLVKSYLKFQLIHRFANYDYKNKVYWIDDNIPPFTFINKTILPAQLKKDNSRDLIIKHEEAHRKTLHFFDIVWVELLSSLLVLNPLNKKIKKYIVENHEFLADDYACGLHKKQYLQVLVEQTIKKNQLTYVSYFAKPTILNRLAMLNSSKRSNFKPFFVAIFLALFSLLFACDINPVEEIVVTKHSNSNVEKKEVYSADKNSAQLFTVVDQQAEPPEGLRALYDAFRQDLEGKYPQEAISKGIEGVVYVQFVIEQDGSLSNVHAVKGIGSGCDEIAVEILKNYGDWIPGRQNGQIVRSQRVIPIRFLLN